MITIDLQGGLGNQMFQYAAARSLAAERNTETVLDLSWFEQKFDTATTPRNYELDCYALDASTRRLTNSLLDRFWIKTARKYQEPHFHFAADFMGLPKNTILHGYFQSEQYFADHRNLVLSCFALKNPSRQAVEFERKIKADSTLSVHVRRGDYVTSKVAADVLGALDIEYYKRAYAAMNKTQTIQRALVFSDDIQWCRQNLKFLKHAIFVQGELSAPEEMWLMSRCSHHIIANSSFSWWGAWLAESTEQMVFAPKRWFLDDSINTADIIPSRWKTL